jgi:hypothetical protein
MIRLLAALALIAVTVLSADAEQTAPRTKLDLTPDTINSASPETNDAALITKAEVLLDRNHFSPGQIDGKEGENFRKALLLSSRRTNWIRQAKSIHVERPRIGSVGACARAIHHF